MKQLAVFFLLLLLAVSGDLKPLDLKRISKDTITVQVEGDVMQEGEVELPLYATVQDALDAVGIKEDADLSALNPATILQDHDLLRIPAFSKEEETKISINTADVQQLSRLPGIGEKTAERIVEYRNTEGLFQAIEDLMKVKGIGAAKFEKLKEQIAL